jgi:glycosyltransferase involved in cell wall biosynthesis
MDLVSIVIPTYNRREFLVEALESVREQTYGSYECIVVDGGSTDGTTTFLNEISDDRINPIIREEPHGVNDARNRAIQEAAGEYIVTLDSDDLLYPYAVERLVDAMNERAPDCAGVFATKELLTQHDRVVTRDVPTGPMTSVTMENARAIGGPSGMLFRHDVLADIGGFDASLPSRGDLDLYLRVLKEYSLFGIDDIACMRRLHDSQLSENEEQIQNGMNAVMEKHCGILDSEDSKQ